MIEIKKARCDNQRKRTCCLEQGAGTLRRERKKGRERREGTGATEHSTIFSTFLISEPIPSLVRRLKVARIAIKHSDDLV